MRTSLFLATLSLLLAPLALADDNNYVVGTCKPRLKSFATIQAAVTGVPAYSTVFVCPGVYSEQVTISQPLNLQGIADSNLNDQSKITLPSGSLTPNVTSLFGEPVFAQVLVQTTGTVNISSITVDGTGGDQGCAPTWLAGIFYASGSSGDINRVRTSNQIDTGCGVGIWVENGAASNDCITIEGNSVHDVDGVGISLASLTPPTLNVSAHDNFISPNAAGIGILANSVNGDLTDNDISNAIAGVFDLAPAVRIASNNISLAGIGLLFVGGTVQGNDIMNTGTGVLLLGSVSGTTVQSNRITLSSQAAIELTCNPATVSHNVVNDALFGLSDVPSGFNGANTFANTKTVSTSCPALGAAILGPLQAAAPLAAPSSYLQWRTPANPFGVRP